MNRTAIFIAGALFGYLTIPWMIKVYYETKD